jgi:hypothetical protein
MTHNLINGNCLDVLTTIKPVNCIFADPFDNIGLAYNKYKDVMPEPEYLQFLEDVLRLCVLKADTVWWSFNAKWTFAMGRIFERVMKDITRPGSGTKLVGKPHVQVFTFGQHNHRDFGNNHRPLWRLKWSDAKLYPDQIRIPSWRQRNGDKRASKKGRVPGDVFDMQYHAWAAEPYDAPAELIPMKAASRGMSEVPIPTRREQALNILRRIEEDTEGATVEIAKALALLEPDIGDVFDFPRVGGNNKQRCDWHPTQLHEELVERCLKMSTVEGDTVLDPFGGTGTTLRVCERINRQCTLIELDPLYCKNIRKNHPKLKFKKFAA